MGCTTTHLFTHCCLFLMSVVCSCFAFLLFVCSIRFQRSELYQFFGYSQFFSVVFLLLTENFYTSWSLCHLGSSSHSFHLRFRCGFSVDIVCRANQLNYKLTCLDTLFISNCRLVRIVLVCMCACV